ncbi:hypothetical protein ACNRBV_04080, partial [Ralstonia pseudosolanacearum]|uniref:hypothetical protein n=1 Tax=Ralstonia pseudosolanacearum TaxID=1310165 RepID=UPI003AAB5CEB
MEQLLEDAKVVTDAKRVLALPARERLSDPWAQAVCRQPGARRFLSKRHVLPATTMQLAYVAMVAKCILDADVAVELT